VLAKPVVLLRRALPPNALLLPLVVFFDNAAKPTAVFWLPVLTKSV